MKFLIFATLLLVFSCAGQEARRSPAPDSEAENAMEETGADLDANGPGTHLNLPSPIGLSFVPDDFPSFEIPQGVGAITRDRRDLSFTLTENERNALSESYRNAYIDNICRGLPLAGVLGGDLVHGWPDDDPSGWVQNWRNSAPAANSWGIPELVLAIRGLTAREGTGGNRVFAVEGKVLDFYGRSAGINGANGGMGYGSPRSYEFIYDRKTAQRFDLGLIAVDREGKASFYPEDPPSLGDRPPPDTGVFRTYPNAAGRSGNTGLSAEDLRFAFISTRKIALDQGIKTMLPDGPGQYLDFEDASRNLYGFFVQSFNDRTVLLVLPDSSILPPFPRIIGSPFLEALLSPLEAPLTAADDLFRALIQGFALYGIPLSDPVLLKGSDNEPWQITQRFSRGWLTGILPGN